MNRREQKAKVKAVSKRVKKAMFDMLDELTHYVDEFDETEADENMQDLLDELTVMNDEFLNLCGELN